MSENETPDDEDCPDIEMYDPHPLYLSDGDASIFDPVVCEIAYRWFCPPAGIVLDPFAGGSVRGIGPQERFA